MLEPTGPEGFHPVLQTNIEQFLKNCSLWEVLLGSDHEGLPASLERHTVLEDGKQVSWQFPCPFKNS